MKDSKECPIFHPDLGRINGDAVLGAHRHNLGHKIYLVYKCASTNIDIPDYALVMGRIIKDSYKDNRGVTVVQCGPINDLERGKLRATVPNRLLLGMGAEISFLNFTG